MKTDLYTKIVLTVIAIVLTVNLLKDVDFVTKAYAGKNEIPSLNVEKEDVRGYDDYTGYYAKDKLNVYYDGVIVEGTSSKDFEIISGDYAKNSNKVYLKGKRIKEADPRTFTPLPGGYAKDSNGTFYNGIKIGERPDSFKVLSN